MPSVRNCFEKKPAGQNIFAPTRRASEPNKGKLPCQADRCVMAKYLQPSDDELQAAAALKVGNHDGALQAHGSFGLLAASVAARTLGFLIFLKLSVFMFLAHQPGWPYADCHSFSVLHLPRPAGSHPGAGH